MPNSTSNVLIERPPVHLDLGKAAPKGSKKNLAIEGLRGLLAMAVLAFHVYRMGETAGFYPASSSRVLEGLGPYAVCVFFCVSGLLIIQTLLSKDDLGEFIRNRVARIYPVFLILHLTIFALGPLANYEWMGKLRFDPGAYASAFFSNLFFLPGVLKLPIAQKNAWSLSFEALFYVLAAGLYWSWKRKGRVAGKMGFAVVLCVAIPTLWSHPIFGFFLIGVAAFMLAERGRLPHIGDWLVFPALAVGLCAFPFSIPLSMAATTLFFIAAAGCQGVFGKMLSNPVLRWLGKISYSLYLVHPFAMEGIRVLLVRIGARAHGFPSGAAFLICGPAAAIIMSYLSFVFVEKKLTNLIFKKKKANVAASPVVSTVLAQS